MKLGEKKSVIMKLNYNQAHQLIGMKWEEYVKYLVIGAKNG
jgi:hypothetical protein